MFWFRRSRSVLGLAKGKKKKKKIKGRTAGEIYKEHVCATVCFSSIDTWTKFK